MPVASKCPSPRVKNKGAFTPWQKSRKRKSSNQSRATGFGFPPGARSRNCFTVQLHGVRYAVRDTVTKAHSTTDSSELKSRCRNRLIIVVLLTFDYDWLISTASIGLHRSRYKCFEAFNGSIRRKNFTNWPIKKLQSICSIALTLNPIL